MINLLRSTALATAPLVLALIALSCDTSALAAGMGLPSESVGDPSVSASGFAQALPLEESNTERLFPFVAGEDNRSVSIGTVTEGTLFHGEALLFPNQHVGVLSVQLARGLQFGTDELIGAIERAATRVAQNHGGWTTWIGNIGRRSGGDIPYSVSHNSGRDADIAFYYAAPTTGVQMVPPDLLPVNSALQSERDGLIYQFDVERNWAFIQALLEDTEIQIQFLFISNALKQRLLEYARSIDASTDTISRAETVMGQPGRRNPHDDHLHIRLYCSRFGVEAGCENIGRTHAWVETYESERREQVRLLRTLLGSADPEERARAIERLTLLGEGRHVERIAALFADPTPRVRAAAVGAIAELAPRRFSPELQELWLQENDLTVISRVAGALSLQDLEAVQGFLIAQLDNPKLVQQDGLTLDGRCFLVDALADLRSVAAVGPLSSLLSEPDPFLRSRVDWALARLTNSRVGADWSDLTLDAASLDAAEAVWNQRLATLNDVPPEDWIVAELVESGFSVDEAGDIAPSTFAEVIERGEAHESLNAQFVLMRAFDRDVRSPSWPRTDASWYWRGVVGVD